MKCVCGAEMRLLESNILSCGACGRARWGNTGIPGGVILLIIVITIVALIVLGIVGNEGAQFRS